MSVEFSDSTKCDVQSASPEEIKCLVAGFDANAVGTTAKSTTVTVNTKNDGSLNINLLSDK